MTSLPAPFASQYPVSHAFLAEEIDWVEAEVRKDARRCERCGERQWIRRRQLTDQEVDDLRYNRVSLETAFIHGRRCLTTCPLFGTDLETISPKGD